MTDLTFILAGQAGQGMQSIAYVLGRLLTRSGYHVFTDQDVMSRVRGGHNFSRLRVCDSPVHAPRERANLLVALDPDSLDRRRAELVPGGVAVFDPDQPATGPRETPAASDVSLFPVPLERLARTVGRNPVMVNSVALGAIAFLTGFPLDRLSVTVREVFRDKGAATVEANLACVRAGQEHGRRFFKGSCPCLIDLPRREARRLYLTGNEALALGAICSGVRFLSGYPMSPATPIMEFLAARQTELGLVVEQCEDEIAGVNMALGASYAGVTAMTATSGGGFALMTETLGLAGISENPLVIVLCSRPGPATGFPTRTEQADLLFVRYASQDEFPRFIFAPGTAEQAFYAMSRAVGLSRRYQVPAIVLSDQFLSDSYSTIDDLDPNRITLPAPDPSRPPAPGSYQRYAGQDPVCIRLLPGAPEQTVISAGHEHDATGRISETVADRNRMTERRLAKLKPMTGELDGITCYPDPNPEIALLGFGSTFGPLREAVDQLRAAGIGAGMVHLSEVYPIPSDHLLRALERSRRLLTVEGNATAQLARLLHAETRLRVSGSILKFDGRPFFAHEIAAGVKDRLT